MFFLVVEQIDSDISYEILFFFLSTRHTNVQRFQIACWILFWLGVCMSDGRKTVAETNTIFHLEQHWIDYVEQK